MANRIQIPISFSYEVTYFVATTSGGSPTTSVNMMLPASGSTITTTNRVTGNPAIVYAAATGSTTISPVVTDAGGNVPGYVPEGSYNFQAAASGSFAGASVNWEAVYGAGVGNVGSGAVDVAQLTAAVAAQLRSPVGSIVQYGGTGDPVDSDSVTRWMICDGRSLSTTTYATLFAAIGNTYGSGSGTFKLPDLRGRVPVGAGQGGGLTNRTLGGSSGEELHLLLAAEGATNGSGTTGNDTPDHSHSGTTSGENSGHTHTSASGTHFLTSNSTLVTDVWTPYIQSGHTPGFWGNSLNQESTTSDRSVSHTHTFGTGGASTRHSHPLNARNADSTHNNMQPYLVVNHIIRVL